MAMGAFNRLLMASSRSPFRGLGLSTAACRSSSSPCLMLPSSTVADFCTSDEELRSMDYSFYRLSDKQTISLRNKGDGTLLPRITPEPFCIGSSNGWLLYCDPQKFSLNLVNPLSQTPPIVPIPSIKSDVFPPIDKFSLSGSPGTKDWGGIMILNKMTQKLEFWNPKSSCLNWIKLDNSSSSSSQHQQVIIDVIYSTKEKMFYTLNLNCEIETWDLNHGNIPKRVKAYQPAFSHHPECENMLSEETEEEWLCTKYLVESKGDILLVLRYNNNNNIEDLPSSKTRRFDVYKLNEEKDSWEHLKSMGDRVVFVGMNEPFSLSASDFPELKPNSIYYTGPAPNEGKYSASDWGIYDLNDRTMSCHYPCDYQLKIRPPPIWIGQENSATSSTCRL